jgi:hypothetical protein
MTSTQSGTSRTSIGQSENPLRTLIFGSTPRAGSSKVSDRKNRHSLKILVSTQCILNGRQMACRAKQATKAALWISRSPEGDWNVTEERQEQSRKQYCPITSRDDGMQIERRPEHWGKTNRENWTSLDGASNVIDAIE